MPAAGPLSSWASWGIFSVPQALFNVRSSSWRLQSAFGDRGEVNLLQNRRDEDNCNGYGKTALVKYGYTKSGDWQLELFSMGMP